MSSMSRSALPAEPAIRRELLGTGESASGSDATISAIADLIEADLRRAARKIQSAGEEMRASIIRNTSTIAGIRRNTDELVEDTTDAIANSEKLTRAIDDLVRSNREIGAKADTSAGLVTEATQVADSAGKSTDALRTAISEINEVVNLISEIAGQTNLLALNATIEAARAGPAGRGFAIVAGEVKSLSVETQKATDEIGHRIARLRETASDSIEAVHRIVALMDRIRPAFAEVSRTVDTQVGVTDSIRQIADQSTRFAQNVSSKAQQIDVAMTSAMSISDVLGRGAETVSRQMGEMNRQLVTSLRQTPQADRRRDDRWPMVIKGTFSTGSTGVAVSTVDVSRGGCLISHPEPGGLLPGIPGTLELDGIGRLSVTIVGRSSLGLHLRFNAASGREIDAVGRAIETIVAECGPSIALVQRVAGQIEGLLGSALASRTISQDDLFDHDYVLVPNSNPVQYRTRTVPFLERTNPPILEPLMQSIPKLVFAITTDVNGYVGVHNRKYSYPQRPGDVVWNTANCRNLRIFDDRTGLLAARNARPFLVQTYPRNMGDGTIIMIREFDAPIVVGGRHWGGVRLGFQS